jgi:parallel beta-helix repeat protein
MSQKQKMPNRATKLLIIAVAIGLLLIPTIGLRSQEPSPEPPEEPPFPEEPHIPGTLEGTGTYFELTDSEYLNVFVQSSEEITILLQSVPETVSMNIESPADSTELTIGNLEANKSYYKFEDSYQNEAVFITNNDGSYTYIQDLTQPHHIWLQEENATVFIPGDCSSVGIWDAQTSTCTLTQDLNESVEIIASNITLDCAGHSITGPGGYGIHFSNRQGVTVKNCNISNFSWGIYVRDASNNILANNTVFQNIYGIYLYEFNNSILTGNNASNNNQGICLFHSHSNALTNNISTLGNYGIELYSSGGNTLTNNTISNNNYNFSLYGNSDSHFDNEIDTTNTVDGKPIYYIKNASNQVYDSSTNAGVFYCVFCNNVTIKDLNLTKNRSGVFFWKTNNSRIENVIASNNDWFGIALMYSDNNTLTNNTTSNNSSAGGIGFFLSNSNTLTNNTVNFNTLDGICLRAVDNNTLARNTIDLNEGHGIFLDDFSNHNHIIENTISNNNYGVRFSYVSGNQIYHNNFIDNACQIYVHEASGSVFDNGYPSGGNYWSDYIGVDLYSGPNQNQPGSDGIGDTPYTFYSGRDRYPFMEMILTNAPPEANANGPYVDDEGSAIAFDASASSDPDGDELQYRWDFDNNGTWDTAWSSSPTATYTWDDDWNGTAKLEVTDSQLTDSAIAPVTVNNVSPVVSAINDGPKDEGIAVIVTASQVDPGTCDTFTYSFDWDNDGIYEIVDQVNPSAQH